MLPSQLLDTATVPGTDTEMTLHLRGDIYSIRVNGVELMNNWIYGMDCGLADHGCDALADKDDARVLVGGLGMGFTVARSLSHLGAASRITVAELVPAVVRWNEEVFGELAGHPLRDPRVKVVQADVGRFMRARPNCFDAILLDVDNGPEGLSRKSNDDLYDRKGLDAARAALRPGGVLAVWSLSEDRSFTERMTEAGFRVDEHRIKKRGGRGRQTIFVGRPRAADDPAPARNTSSPRAAPRGRDRKGGRSR